MIITENAELKNFSLMRMGGKASILYTPESVNEVIELISGLNKNQSHYYLIGGGSNVLINDQHDFDNVIYLGRFNPTIAALGNGRFYVGASVRLQRLIREINDLGYGGIEYLYSVPGMLGGAIVMNAGRGKQHCQSIGDYIESVDVLNNGIPEQLNCEQCRFRYRSSIFSSGNYLITGATFQFPPVALEAATLLRQERIEYCKINQDASLPNLGSLLKKSNRFALWLLKRFHLGYSEGIHFSSKTPNWLVNEGLGTFSQAMDVIHKSKVLHRLLGCRQELEIVIWK